MLALHQARGSCICVPLKMEVIVRLLLAAVCCRGLFGTAGVCQQQHRQGRDGLRGGEAPVAAASGSWDPQRRKRRCQCYRLNVKWVRGGLQL